MSTKLPSREMETLPTGTVTFLYTDIEGSTALAQQFPAELPALLARHHAIMHQAIQAHHGYVFQITGDAFCAAFHTASDTLKAALDAQRGLQHEAWHPAPIKVRMGIHTAALRAANGMPASPLYKADNERDVAVAREQLDEAAFNIAWSAGQAMTLEQAFEYAMKED